MLATTAVGLAACGGDDPVAPPAPVEVDYALAVVAGAWPDQTTYIQGLASLPASSVGTQNAVELARSGSMWAYDGALYVYTFGAPATMTRFTFNNEGVPVRGAEMVTPGANTYSTLQFISPTEAYASVAGGLARLVRFNPTEMRTIGEIDLTSLARPVANSLWYVGSHVRDGKLYLAVDFQQNFDAVYDSAFIAVIDLATQSLEKLISDGRTAMIFAAGLGVNAFVEDAAGNIYVQARGNRDSGGNAPSGVLRIRKGQTEFDPDYFLNLDEALGGPGYGLWHFPQEGVTFTFRAMDPADRWDFGGPSHRLYRLDLAARTSLGAVPGVPLTEGSSTQFMRRFEPGRIHFAVAAANEDAVYVYDVASGQASRVFTSSGGQISGLEKLR